MACVGGRGFGTARHNYFFLLRVDRFAGDFFAAGFFAGDFFAVGFLAGLFAFDAGFLAGLFLAAGRLPRRRGRLRGRPVRGPVRLGRVAFDAAPHFFAAGLAAGFAGDFFAACA